MKLCAKCWRIISAVLYRASTNLAKSLVPGLNKMGLLTDILKEVPLSTELRKKIAKTEAENDALKTENVILKDDLREAKAYFSTGYREQEQIATTISNIVLLAYSLQQELQVTKAKPKKQPQT